MAHAQEPDLVFQRNESAGVSVQSTTGSRGLRISGQRLYRPCSDVQSKAPGYPLHSHLSPPVRHRVPSGSERAILEGRRWDFKPVTYPMPSTVRLQSLYWESTGTNITYRRFLLSTVASRGYVCNSGFPKTGVEAFNTRTQKFIHWLLERMLIQGKQHECHGISIICKCLTKLVVFRNYELCTILLVDCF